MSSESEEIDFEEEVKDKLTFGNVLINKKDKVSENIGWVFVIFTILWSFIIAINRFYDTPAWPVLLIPYAMMGIGFLNKDEISDDKVQGGVFSATFISMGLIIAFPLLTYLNNKILGCEAGKEGEKTCDPAKKALFSQLNHIIFIAVILTLLSYIHIWVDESMRHVCMIIRSCFETIATTLYILVFTIYLTIT